MVLEPSDHSPIQTIQTIWTIPPIWTIPTMKRILPLLLCALALSAHATVLVHDGFDLSAGYSAGGLKGQPASAYRSSQTSFVSAAWSVWNDTSVVYVHGAGNGLSYPASGWEDFTAVDSSIGFNHSTAGAMNRTVYRTM